MKHEGVLVNGLEAWIEAGRRLGEVDPKRFAEVLAFARLYLTLHERELESEAVFQSRLTEISGDNRKAQA